MGKFIKNLKCIFGAHDFSPWVGHIEYSDRLAAIPMQFELCFCERCGTVLGKMRR